MPRPWVFSLMFGLSVGAGVVLVNSLRYGLSAPLIGIGIVLAIGFGGLALLGALLDRRTNLD